MTSARLKDLRNIEKYKKSQLEAHQLRPLYQLANYLYHLSIRKVKKKSWLRALFQQIANSYFYNILTDLFK